ncbi:hypothetical protein HDU76_007457 [Blyttiomyces sp. JEL0837]|nr:hypothetical protein HDU76_007457 [Blyttiomyces sp. JEL0837]
MTPAQEALLLLEKTFRLPRPEDKDRAILEFLDYFATFPSQENVNAGVLRLADFWRESNNPIRQSIYKVLKLSMLNSVIQIDGHELVSRLKLVMISNDPIARALTLRLYGILARHLYENVDVQHSVLVSLDSEIALEWQAGVYASERICAFSRTFVMAVVQKIDSLVEHRKALVNPTVIQTLKHMHVDMVAAKQALRICIDIISSKPTEELSLAAIAALTALTHNFPMFLPQHIQYLIEYLNGGLSEGALFSCLHYLFKLSKTSSQHFSTDQVQFLFQVFLRDKCPRRVKTRVLDIISELCLQPPLYQVAIKRYLDYTNQITTPEDNTMLAVALTKHGSIDESLQNRLTLGLDGLVQSTIQTDGDEKIPTLISKFLHIGRSVNSMAPLAELFLTLMDHPSRLATFQRAFETLYSEGKFYLTGDLQAKLNNIPEVTADFVSVALFMISLRPRNNADYQPWVSRSLFERILEFADSKPDSLWQRYLLAKSLFLGGHFALAGSLFEELREMSSSDTTSLWLGMLSDISASQRSTLAITSHTLDQIAKSEHRTQKAMSKFSVRHLLSLSVAMINYVHSVSDNVNLREEELSSEIHQELRSLATSVSALQSKFIDIDRDSYQYLSLLRANFESLGRVLSQVGRSKSGDSIMEVDDVFSHKLSSAIFLSLQVNDKFEPADDPSMEIKRGEAVKNGTSVALKH